MLAAVQTLSSGKVSDNLDVAASQIAASVAAGAEFVALPEYFACLNSSGGEAKVSMREQDGNGPIQSFLSNQAKQHGIWLAGGTLPIESVGADKVRNTMMVYNPLGERVVRYDKIHLFGFQRGAERYDESETIEPGDAVVVLDAPFGRVGLAVCYDLRFPELFRAMGEVDLIVLPAAFTYTTGQAHWEVLLRARAIENQCYVMAPAQGGRHASGRRTYGHSIIIDPWGEVLACREEEGPGFVVAEWRRARINEVRANLPALLHRKLR